MLTVPTTPITSISGLPNLGGWSGVCLRLANPLRTGIPRGRSTGLAFNNNPIQPQPGLRPTSKTP